MKMIKYIIVLNLCLFMPITNDVLNAEFELYQSIPTIGVRDFEFFTINDEKYLAIINSKDSNTYNINSVIYKWNGNSFIEFQSISTNGGRDFEFFILDGEYYIAAINYFNDSTRKIDSHIYKWNGTNFSIFQSI